jgi:3D (Asp-Asp-Asp) domain-containing protein
MKHVASLLLSVFALLGSASCSLPFRSATVTNPTPLIEGEKYEVRRALPPSAPFNPSAVGSYFVMVGKPVTPALPGEWPDLQLAPEASLTTVAFKLSAAPPLRNAANPQPRKVRTTAYCHREADHIPYGNKSAAGNPLRFGAVRSTAADWSRYPLGTLFRIADQPDVVYQVDDYGSGLVGTDTIDLYKPTIAQMRDWGVRHVDIEVIRLGCFQRSRQLLKDRTKYPHVREMLDSIHRRIYEVTGPVRQEPEFPLVPLTAML